MEQWNIWLLLIGVVILLSNFVDISYLTSKVLSFRKENNSPSRAGFLEIISLWYQLKTKCDEHNLKIASEKLDEVFPLLNKLIEE
jgi:hypothetical protein